LYATVIARFGVLPSKAVNLTIPIPSFLLEPIARGE
jgi:hypothetical protein